MEKQVVCFGEVLWDVLPQGRKPGGAPMNVAYHLKRLGIKSQIISRVGADTLGQELCAFLQQIGLSTHYIQRDNTSPTSQVIAMVNENHEMAYDIVESVAWDYIQENEAVTDLVAQSDILVFGSLIARNEIARNSLYQLLDKAKYRFFDVNLRPPHYNRTTLEYLLRKANAVKVNHHELQMIGEWLGSASDKETDNVALIQDTYDLAELIVTKGAQGASYYTPYVRYDYPAYPIEVVDTIGSGDSFLAAFIAQKLKEAPIEDMLDYATAMGAFVTSKSGANPIYSQADFNRFIWEKKLEIMKWK